MALLGVYPSLDDTVVDGLRGGPGAHSWPTGQALGERGTLGF